MIRRKRKAIVKVVVITHYPSALRGFIAAAEHYDRVAPGWGQLVLFDSAQRLQKDDEQGLREAVETAGCVVVDLMRSDPEWYDFLAPVLERFQGHLLAFGIQFAERARLGAFMMPSDNEEIGRASCRERV